MLSHPPGWQPVTDGACYAITWIEIRLGDNPCRQEGRESWGPGWTGGSDGGPDERFLGRQMTGTCCGERGWRQQQCLTEGHTSSYGLIETWSRGARPRALKPDCEAWVVGCTCMTGSGAPVFQRKPLTHRSLSWSPRRIFSMTEILISAEERQGANEPPKGIRVGGTGRQICAHTHTHTEETHPAVSQRIKDTTNRNDVQPPHYIHRTKLTSATHARRQPGAPGGGRAPSWPAESQQTL